MLFVFDVLIHPSSTQNGEYPENELGFMNDANNVAASNLVSVNVVYRHGARSPKFANFPNDPNNMNFSFIWPNGEKQLSENGMQMQYALGAYFRERYGSFLSNMYKRDEIYVRSTDLDRALMSAQCNLAGLYPPAGKQKWNGSLTSWQPIPVHTVGLDDEELLRFPLRSNCPLYDKLLLDIRSSKTFISHIENHKNFLKNISDLAGFNETADDVVLLSNARKLYSTIQCNLAENLIIPSWIDFNVITKLKEFAGFDYLSRFGDIGEEYQRIAMAKLNGGILLKKIISNLQDSVEGTNSLKFIQYSAHDTTLIPLLSALNISNNFPAPFASCLLFELYKDVSQNKTAYYIRTYYKNTTTGLFPMQALGCQNDCNFNEFIKRAKLIMPESNDINVICKIHENKQAAMQFIEGNIFLFFILIAILIAIFAIIVYYAKKRGSFMNQNEISMSSLQKMDYQPLNNVGYTENF